MIDMNSHFKIGDIVFWFDPDIDNVREGTIKDIGEDRKRVTVKETDTGTVWGLWMKNLI
jgi:hypothetical protein